jgi:DNA-binding MarR family transcriptional regulator
MSRDDPEIDLTVPALGGLLRLVHLTHLRRVYEQVTTTDFRDVTPAQFKLFRWPGMDGLRPSELAQRNGLSKQAVNDLIGELERNGYVERHPDPGDARARLLKLTSRGDRLLRATHRTSLSIEAAWAESVGQERFAALRSTLVDMLERGLPEPQPPD